MPLKLGGNASGKTSRKLQTTSEIIHTKTTLKKYISNQRPCHNSVPGCSLGNCQSKTPTSGVRFGLPLLSVNNQRLAIELACGYKREGQRQIERNKDRNTDT